MFFMKNISFNIDKSFNLNCACEHVKSTNRGRPVGIKHKVLENLMLIYPRYSPRRLFSKWSKECRMLGILNRLNPFGRPITFKRRYEAFRRMYQRIKSRFRYIVDYFFNEVCIESIQS